MTAGKVRILIVDDQELFRKALATLLTTKKEFEIIGDASNGQEAVDLAMKVKPDIILMDLRMPVMSGAEATAIIRKQLPECRVIVLTTFDDKDAIFEGLHAGATGYLLKDATTEDLTRAIQQTFKGGYVLAPTVTAKLVDEINRLNKPSQIEKQSFPLTKRELEIIKLVAQGKSNLDIAKELVITEGTVKNHMSNILEKLEAKDRLQAVLKAQNYGLV